MEVSDAKRLRTLERENAVVKRLGGYNGYVPNVARPWMCKVTMARSSLRRIPHALSCTTTHENKTALRYAGATTSLHSRRGYAGALCPKQSLTRASLPHHHLSPPLGEHAEATCPRS
jgi:hypothetical protein